MSKREPEKRNSRESSRLRVLRFENALEDVVKRHRSLDWAIAAARKLKSISDNYDGPVWAPYELLHSIEACCAYSRGNRNEPVTELRLRQAVNVFRDDDSPYEEYLLTETADIAMYMLVQFRKQIEVQENRLETRHLTGRYHHMFGRNKSICDCQGILQTHFGLTLDSWAAYCIDCYGQATERDFGGVRLEGYPRASPKLFTQQSCDSFVAISSRTPDLIKTDYRSQRDGLKSPHMHVCLRSGFLNYPMISFGGDRLLAPQPHLLIRHLFTGLERAISHVSEDVWTHECGTCFEEYVLSLITTLPGVAGIRRPDQESGHEQGRRCDFLVDLGSCDLYVECKATRLRQRLLVREQLQRDSSSERLQDAIVQLTETARCNAREQPARKPLIAVVITLDEIFEVNRRWYWRHVLLPKIDLSMQRDGEYVGPFSHPPQIMSILAFEMLVAILRQSTNTLTDMVETQARLHERYEHGDWPRSLRDICSSQGINPTIPELKMAFEDFTTRIEPLLRTE
jgi:hypothetical protein